MSSLAPLLQRLGYEFEDEALAHAALTHRSAGKRHNERLEFLGDALLDLVVSEELYRRVPAASEGDLSRLRASLVRREALAKIANELELGRFVHLGSGELRSGGAQRRSILADAFEALIGAIFLDGGYRSARDCLLRLYRGRLQRLPDPQSLRDPKTRLQELLQARGLPRPVYELADVGGAEHERQFEVLCVVDSFEIRAEGRGTSRRRAEQSAAAAALEMIGTGQSGSA